VAVSTDLELVDRLRAGDEQAFAELVERYQARLVGLARQFVSNPEAAQDAVQDTWLAVLRGVDRFEGRAPLRAWLFQVCVNRARSHAAKERRLVPVGSGEPAVDPARFGPDARWATPPQHWVELADDRLEAAAAMDRVRAAIERLPQSQQLVVTLRDVEGLTSQEVCEVLSVSEANQRVLLHRGRSAVRRALGDRLGR